MASFKHPSCFEWVGRWVFGVSAVSIRTRGERTSLQACLAVTLKEKGYSVLCIFSVPDAPRTFQSGCVKKKGMHHSLLEWLHARPV